MSMTQKMSMIFENFRKYIWCTDQGIVVRWNPYTKNTKKNRALACALKTALKRPFQTRYDIELKSAKSGQTRTNE